MNYSMTEMNLPKSVMLPNSNFSTGESGSISGASETLSDELDKLMGEAKEVLARKIFLAPKNTLSKITILAGIFDESEKTYVDSVHTTKTNIPASEYTITAPGITVSLVD